MIIKKLIIVLFYGPNEAITGRPGRKYRTFWDFCEQFNFLQCGHENKIQKLGRILLEHNEAAPGPGFVRVTGWKRHFDKPGTKLTLQRAHQARYRNNHDCSHLSGGERDWCRTPRGWRCSRGPSRSGCSYSCWPWQAPGSTGSPLPWDCPEIEKNLESVCFLLWPTWIIVKGIGIIFHRSLQLFSMKVGWVILSLAAILHFAMLVLGWVGTQSN